MKCPECGSQDLQVKETRDGSYFNGIRRRRLCVKCGLKFTAYEVVGVAPKEIVRSSEKAEKDNSALADQNATLKGLLEDLKDDKDEAMGALIRMNLKLATLIK